MIRSVARGTAATIFCSSALSAAPEYLQARPAPEGGGVGEREYVGERLDGTAQGMREQHVLGDEQAMLPERRRARAQQLVGRARLGQEAEELAVVDGADRG